MSFNDLLGKKFKLGGTGPDEFDCFGLCCEVRRRVGLPFIDSSSPEEMDLLEIQHRINAGAAKEFVRLEKPQDYCVVTFRMRRRMVSHMGIVLPGCHQFIHILKKQSVIISRLDNIFWAKKIEGFYKYDKPNKNS